MTEQAIGRIAGDLSAFFATRLGGLLANLLVCLLIICSTWVVVRIVRYAFARVERRMLDAGKSTVVIVQFSRHIVVAVLWFSGVWSAVNSFAPVESMLNKLLAAGGVLAVVAGIASQEALGSMVSGLMILAFRPFRLGDVIRYVDHDIAGVVEEITLHHTAIRTWENKRVIVPNSKMNAAVIENADYGDSRVCVLLEVGVTYESDIALAKRLLAEAVLRQPLHLDGRTPQQKAEGADEAPVVVLRLDDSAVVLRASLWAADHGAAFALKCAVQEQLLADFAAHGVDIAYPHLVVQQKA